jgi:predicted glycoside hydrolase/deacetylase ChbG (UPF0249 family)
MVRWPAAADAADCAHERRGLSLGLHLDLGEWTCRDGTWVPLYQVVDPSDPAAVGAEVMHQLEAFRTLVGRNPTHLDSHQHVHRREPTRSILGGHARSLGIPLRHFSTTVAYCGRFYGQDDQGRSYPEGVSAAGLIRLLEGLPPGFTELGCHPAVGDDLETMYGTERSLEVATLCDPRVRAALASLRIECRTFMDVADRSLNLI